MESDFLKIISLFPAVFTFWTFPHFSLLFSNSQSLFSFLFLLERKKIIERGGEDLSLFHFTPALRGTSEKRIRTENLKTTKGGSQIEPCWNYVPKRKCLRVNLLKSVLSQRQVKTLLFQVPKLLKYYCIVMEKKPDSCTPLLPEFFLLVH